MKLSIIVPAIRKSKWLALYESIKKSCHSNWELFIVGPYEPDFERDNLRWIKDWGSPVKCAQKAVSMTDADYITFGADDGLYTPNSIDKMVEFIDEEDYKNVVVTKHVESDNSASLGVMTDPNYYRINFHNGLKSNIPDNYLQMMGGMCSRKLFMEVGGFDCKFETGAYAHIDLSIRLQMYGASLVLQDNVIFYCSWSPGMEGDHGPIHTATMENDLPYYYKLYRETEKQTRVVIPFDNWKDQPERWVRRFGK